jgi:hypothetical protein
MSLGDDEAFRKVFDPAVAEYQQKRRKLNSLATMDVSRGRSSKNSGAQPHDWDDPDMSVLDDRRGDLPNFPIDVFTPPIREWLERAAHGAGVFPDHVAVPMLGVVASLIRVMDVADAALCGLRQLITGLSSRLAQVFFQLARLMPAASVWIRPTHLSFGGLLFGLPR